MELPEDSLAVTTLVRHALAQFPTHHRFIKLCHYGIVDFSSLYETRPTLDYALGAALFLQNDMDPQDSFSRLALMMPTPIKMPQVYGSPTNATIQQVSTLIQHRIYVIMLDGDTFQVVFKTQETHWGRPPIYLYRDTQDENSIFYMHTFNNTKSHLFCKICGKVFTVSHFQTHKCVYAKCRFCARICAHPNISPTLGGLSHCFPDTSFQKQCLACNQTSRNEECYKLHKLWPSRSCKIFEQCIKCNMTVRRYNRHICGQIFCQQCYELHEKGTSSCYIKRNQEYKQLRKRGKPILVYCMQIISDPNLYIISRIDSSGCGSYICQNSKGFTPVIGNNLENPLAPTNTILEPGPLPPLGHLLSHFFRKKNVYIVVQELDFYLIMELLQSAKVTISECTIIFHTIIIIKSTAFLNFDLQTHAMQLQRIPCVLPNTLWSVRYARNIAQYIDKTVEGSSAPQVTTWITALKHAIASKMQMPSYLVSILIYNFHTYKAILVEMNKVFINLATTLEKYKRTYRIEDNNETFCGTTIVPKKANIFAYASAADAGFSVFKSCLSNCPEERIMLPPARTR